MSQSSGQFQNSLWVSAFLWERTKEERIKMVLPIDVITANMKVFAPDYLLGGLVWTILTHLVPMRMPWKLTVSSRQHLLGTGVVAEFQSYLLPISQSFQPYLTKKGPLRVSSKDGPVIILWWHHGREWMPPLCCLLWQCCYPPPTHLSVNPGIFRVLDISAF